MYVLIQLNSVGIGVTMRIGVDVSWVALRGIRKSQCPPESAVVEFLLDVESHTLEYVVDVLVVSPRVAERLARQRHAQEAVIELLRHRRPVNPPPEAISVGKP